ncbi:hypothetical protein DFH06DRAFT_1153477 [Mycena polygramma]|nr:hypothetical protein DFH06DRAFT_1153477 [Mycena polygramma]
MSTSILHEDPADGNPRTSTPPPGRSSSQEVTAPDFEASAEFEDSPLQDYSGPVPDNNVDPSAPARRTQVTVPTLKPLSKIGNNAQILARRTEALAKGASGTGKDFLLTATKASRRLYQHVFPKEFQLLDALLTEVEILQLFGMGAGYRVEKDQFRLLLRILQKLRAIAEDSFTVDGKTPPPLPTWGDDEDILEVYDQNAFEILGVCFRVEVENFLVLLDKYYDYHEGKPQERHIDLDKAADEFIRTHKSLSVADRSDQTARVHEEVNISKRSASNIPPTRGGSLVRFSIMSSNTDLPRTNQRMGEVLNPMAATFQSRKGFNAPNLPTHPEEAEQMRRMTPQGDFGGRDAPPHMQQGNRGYTSGACSPPGFRRGAAPPVKGLHRRSGWNQDSTV